MRRWPMYFLAGLLVLPAACSQEAPPENGGIQEESQQQSAEAEQETDIPEEAETDGWELYRYNQREPDKGRSLVTSVHPFQVAGVGPGRVLYRVKSVQGPEGEPEWILVPFLHEQFNTLKLKRC